jgi:atypical dual specificity phosphatase
MPQSRQEIDWLVQEGIQAVVSLSRLRQDLTQYLGEHCIEHLDLPIPDFEAPTLEEANACFEFLKSHLDEGKPVLVHCGAGIGRTGTLLSFFLVRQGEDLEEAILRSGGEPESREQRDFLNKLPPS